MRRLVPAEIAEAYAYPAGAPWLRANMVASADGAAWRAGRSGALGGEADRRLLSVLRALADVVVVGAGTVRVEGYGPVRRGPSWGDLRDGRPPTPPLAIVSRSLDLDFDGPLFAEAHTIVITCTAAPQDRMAVCRKVADVIVAGEDAVDVGTALDSLAERGYARLLTEGGPTLLAEFASAGRLDELCLTLSPQLVGGDAARIVNGPGLATNLRLGHALMDDDFLFLRYVRE
jgi:riboflavin biosynthesis pyrimidine reductase